MFHDLVQRRLAARLPAGARLGVAVSGGADSVCLLHLLHRLGRHPLHVLHLNHNLRPAEALADQRFVENLAALLGLPCHVDVLEPGALRGNLEQAAREARRGFFAKAMNQFQLDAVATGHTASDQAETVLFRLLRGTGPAGLAGILPETREGLVRPLLDLSRDEIRSWLAAENLPWREDSSNLDPRFARNRLRLETLPALEQIRPGAGRHLASLAALAAEEEEFWQAYLDQTYPDLLQSDGPAVLLDITRLAPLPTAVQRRLLRRAVFQARGSLAGLDAAHFDLLLRWALEPAASGRRRFPALEAWRSFHLLRLAAPAPPEPAWGGEVAACGLHAIGPYLLEVAPAQSLAPPPPAAGHNLYNGGSGLLDGDRLDFPWCLRPWRAGDRYQPASSARPRSLKEMFQRARIPSWNRASWPILAVGARIVWSARFGPASAVAAGPECRRALRVLVWPKPGVDPE